MQYYNKLQTEELWVQTLLELGFLNDAVQLDDAGLSATGLSSVLRALMSLRKDGPLSANAEEDFGFIHDALDEVMTRETLGFRNIFDGTFDPELGDIGQIKQVPILSNQGGRADVLMRDVKKIRAMRDLLSARIDADLQIARRKTA